MFEKNSFLFPNRIFYRSTHKVKDWSWFKNLLYCLLTNTRRLLLWAYHLRHCFCKVCLTIVFEKCYLIKQINVYHADIRNDGQSQPEGTIESRLVFTRFSEKEKLYNNPYSLSRNFHPRHLIFLCNRLTFKLLRSKFAHYRNIYWGGKN